jgi:hypothetical protein
MTEKTIHGQLVALRTGVYTVYVFQDDENNYHMCTKLPNWGSEYSLQKGDSGFLTMQAFISGEQYYDRKSSTYRTIKYTNVYFKDFIKDTNYATKDIIL